MTLPVALSGSDVIGQAKTGTGKTLGFGLPLLERVVVPADVEAGRAKPEQLTDAPQALVVVPTRELCQQVTNDLLTAGKVRNVRVLAIYGGRAYEPQVEALKKGVDVIVGTPGRLLDLAGQKKLDLSHVKALVLDEADEMLDLGFLPDVERIMMMLPAKRQTMLFSATMPGAVISLARRYMSQPTHIRATAPDDEGQTVANITQHVFRAHNMDKPELVSRILQAEERALAMVFCRTKRTAADIADQLARRGFASGAVHGDLGQGAREQALRAFRNGKVDVLVCTDVAARGIDVDNVTHVINYQSPEDEKTYLHRIGRTGRAGKSGTAVTLVDWDDIPRWKLINKALDLPFDEPEETYSTSPHLYELLNIPAGTKGILPRSERTRAGLAAEEIEDLGETGGRGPRGRGPKQATAVEEERPARTRTPRQRRRTRGGATGGAEAPAAAVAATPVAEPVTRPAAQPVAEGAPETPSKPRRRRRTRHSASSAAAPVAAAATTTTEAAPAPAPVAAAEPEQPRRRRPRMVKPLATDASEPGFQTVETAARALAASSATIPSQAKAGTEVEEKPKRTRKAAAPKADAETVATVAVEEKPKRTRKAAAPKADAVVVEEKPKRTRKAAAPKVETETVVTEEKPKRTRKAAAPKVEAEAVEAEAKPKRTRKAAAPKADAETVAVEEKPKRTRKAAAPKADAAETEEKPKRTRKAAAPKAETVEAEEKPKRTRKAAAPKAETVEAEEKPKRTRKAAAPKADGAEAPVKRTRKAAAPKVAAS
ncbi:DEAD/DEAH box helicase [Streptomyces sp. NPDC051162]|uniref:DEAD/DEAH box helicase n=1 Tax=Streptomyces sp. NPDC051162 TaxID=3154747 RepID=UPI00342B30DA